MRRTLEHERIFQEGYQQGVEAGGLIKLERDKQIYRQTLTACVQGCATGAPKTTNVQGYQPLGGVSGISGGYVPSSTVRTEQVDTSLIFSMALQLTDMILNQVEMRYPSAAPKEDMNNDDIPF